MCGDFYTGDLHFCHPLVAGLRGFTSADEHDDAIIAAVNKMAGPDDRLWVAGDCGVPRNSEQAARVLARVGEIRAQVHVLLGNHDGPHPENRRSLRQLRRWEASGVFASIQLADCHWLAGRKVMISHFPYAGDHTGTDRYAGWRLRNTGRVLLHAHTHDHEQLTRPAVTGGAGLALRQVNIGLEAWGLRPAPRHVLEKLIAEEFGAGEG